MLVSHHLCENKGMNMEERKRKGGREGKKEERKKEGGKTLLSMQIFAVYANEHS